MNTCLRLLLALILCGSALGENWPFWRGPSRQGISTESGLPVHWSAESNVVWKTEIPGEAWSSPIVFGEQVFVTTTTESGVNCHVIAVDRKSGKAQWNKKVFEQTPLKKEQRNSYATPTPATDGERVYAVFGDGSVVAVDAKSGDVVWEYREVKFYSQHGLGASPVLYGDLLIMPFDASSQGEDKKVGWQIPWDKSFILAFDKKTGAVRWKGARGMSRIAHVTPNIMEWKGEDILVSGAGDVVQGFSLRDGRRLWSFYSQGEGVVPSIVISDRDDIAVSISGFEKPAIRAVRAPKEKGAEPELVWEQRKGVPMIPSLVLVENWIYGITEGGVAVCLDYRTGEIRWQERVGGNHSASPVWAENRLYFLNEEGETTVVDVKDPNGFTIVARNPLKEKTQASMAVSEKQLFIRTAKNLYCIGRK